jgi:hypothetical protein
MMGTNVGFPASVAVRDVSNRPALSLAAPVLLTVLTLTAFSVSPSLSAAPPKHRAATANGHSEQKAKFKGTLLSISRDGDTVQLNLSGGVTMTLPQKSVTVVDERSHTAIRSTVGQLEANMPVIVKTHMDKSGKITEAKIRIGSR